MKRLSPDRAAAGFTLLELLVVLVILATVTALAVRSVDGVLDQQKYEMSQRGLEEIEAAVLGSPDDRATDGSRTISGFVADMGRLPKTVEKTIDGVDVLTLAELWERGVPPLPVLPPYDIRTSAVDPQIRLPTGWRGPYVRLPLGGVNLLDGWGNAYVSPPDPSPPDPAATGYARLRDENDAPITTAGEPIFWVRHLGANGTDDALDTSLDRTSEITFKGRFKATIDVTVQILDDEGNTSPGITTEKLRVRVYGPDPDGSAGIKAFESPLEPASTSPVHFSTFTDEAELTIGPRAVRAYLYQSDGTTLTAVSSIKHVTLKAGVNFVPMTIGYTPPSTPPP